KLEPGFRLMIYELAAEISISKNPSSADLDYAQEQQIVVNIVNGGSKNAENGVYTENIPDGLTVTKVSEGASFAQNTVKWVGSIAAGRSKSFTYTLKIMKYGEYGLKGNFSYSYEGVSKSLQTKKSTIESEPLYSVDFGFNKNTAAIDSITKLILSVENNDEESVLEIKDLYISGPADFILTDYPESFEREGSTGFSYSGTIPAQKTHDFEISYKTPYTGKYNASLNTTLEINGFSFIEEKKDSVSVETDKLDAWVALPVKSIRSRGSYRVQVFLKNNADIKYYNANLTLSSQLFEDISFFAEEIDPGEQQEIYNQLKTSPSTLSKQKFAIFLNGSYNSLNKEKFYINTQSQLEIAPANKSFSLSKTLSKSSAKPGENITVHVYAQNMLDESARGVSVKETIPSAINLRDVQGNTETVIDVLEGNTKEEALVYKFTIPADFSEEEIELKTSMSVDVLGETYREDVSSVIRVEPAEKIAEEQGDKIIKKEDTVPAKAEEQQKRSLFNTIVDSIEDFFKKILG
ncbi:MAG: hypothetical protein V1659_03335, partial [Candidatus Woesearchaeota archaeon]